MTSPHAVRSMELQISHRHLRGLQHKQITLLPSQLPNSPSSNSYHISLWLQFRAPFQMQSAHTQVSGAWGVHSSFRAHGGAPYLWTVSVLEPESVVSPRGVCACCHLRSRLRTALWWYEAIWLCWRHADGGWTNQARRRLTVEHDPCYRHINSPRSSTQCRLSWKNWN